MIKAVIFDMFETLVTLFEGRTYFGENIAADVGADPVEFRKEWHLIEDDRSTGKCTIEEGLEIVLKKLGVYSEENVKLAASKRRQALGDTFSAIPEETFAMLKGLKERGIYIGLITNTFSDERDMIRESALFPYFDVALISFEQGICKPDLSLYKKMTELLNVKADECLYVGDGGSKELYAAREAGMHPLQCTWFHDMAFEPHIPCPILDEFEHAVHQRDVLAAAVPNDTKEEKMFDIPEYKKVRVVIDTDAACEADDPFAIVQALLSPKLIVKGIAAEHFVQEESMMRSYMEICTILDAMDMDVPVLKGQRGPLSEDSELSEAAAFIIEEAMRDDDKPLFILCQGAITNVAMAVKQEPAIMDRMTIIWIGTHGSLYGAAPFREFNAGNDIEAANYIIGQPTQLWLVPSYVYTTINIGIAEIKRRIAPCGKIGEHLYTNLIEYNCSEGAGWTKGESWSLGDSPAIALALNPDCGRYEITTAPYIEDDTASRECPDNRKIRIYKDVDSRYILEDLIAKLELFTQAG